MLFYQNIELFIKIIMGVITFMIITLSFPIIGFIRKRWKGLALGCLIQPVVCIAAIVVTALGIEAYEEHRIDEQKASAMLTLRKKEANGDVVHTWYLKDFEECLYDYEEGDTRTHREERGDGMRLFDVVPLDSTSVSIDDRVVVRFDYKKRQITATDFDEPIEVVSIDWDKISGKR